MRSRGSAVDRRGYVSSSRGSRPAAVAWIGARCQICGRRQSDSAVAVDRVPVGALRGRRDSAVAVDRIIHRKPHPLCVRSCRPPSARPLPAKLPLRPSHPRIYAVLDRMTDWLTGPRDTHPCARASPVAWCMERCARCPRGPFALCQRHRPPSPNSDTRGAASPVCAGTCS